MIWNSNIFWGLLGLMSGYIWHYLGKKRKILTYEILTNTLISNVYSDLNEISVEYNGNKIKTLYSSVIRIRNEGNDIIEKQDFASANTLSISTSGCFILDKNGEIKQEIEAINADTYCTLNDNVENDRQKADVLFDYISKKEEVVVTLFHTEPISISGKLKDGKIIEKKEIDTKQRYITISTLILSALMFSFAIGNAVGRGQVYDQLYQEIYEVNEALESLKEVCK